MFTSTCRIVYTELKLSPSVSHYHHRCIFLFLPWPLYAAQPLFRNFSDFFKFHITRHAGILCFFKETLYHGTYHGLIFHILRYQFGFTATGSAKILWIFSWEYEINQENVVQMDFCTVGPCHDRHHGLFRCPRCQTITPTDGSCGSWTAQDCVLHART